MDRTRRSSLRLLENGETDAICVAFPRTHGSPASIGTAAPLRSPPHATRARRVGSFREDAVQFTFASSIYVLECGHSSGVRSNNVAEAGDRWHCATCDA